MTEQDKEITLSTENIFLSMKSNNTKVAFGPLVRYINSLEIRTEAAEAELAAYNKDAEIQKLRAQIDRLHKRSLHIFSAQELEEYKKLDLGSTVRVEFKYTGIGPCTKVEDKHGVWHDITDVGNW